MNLKFTKMHGLGNDFVVIDGVTQAVDLSRENIKFIADRRIGVGCDQVLLLEPARRADTDFYYRIFNADGGEVAQCGNGARCLARFVMDKALTTKKSVKVETDSGIIELVLQSAQQVTVNMGVPRFEPKDLPMIADKTQESYILDVGDEQIELGAVSMGNPHAVVIVSDINNAPVATTGKSLASHASFPQGVNAGFMEIVNRRYIKLRVYERGVGETLACGSGACAAVAYGRARDLLDTQVEVELKGGHLFMQYKGEAEAMFMTGPAETVFEGNIEL